MYPQSILQRRSDDHVFETGYAGGDSRRWRGDGSDNDHDERHSGEE
jgi:hypothetical protein